MNIKTKHKHCFTKSGERTRSAKATEQQAVSTGIKKNSEIIKAQNSKSKGYTPRGQVA